MVGWSIRVRLFCAALMVVSVVVAVPPSPSTAQEPLGCAIPATQTTNASTMTVTDRWPDLWIRSGPSRDCDTIVEKVAAGATVTRTAITADGNWSNVRSAAGNTGWVESDRLTSSDGGGSTSSEFQVIASPEGYTTLGVRSEDRRTTPNEENVIAWLAVGDVVVRGNTRGEWSEVTTRNDVTGWVETNRLAASDGNTSSTSNQFRVNGNYDRLGVRSAPEQTTPNEANVVTWVPKGDIVARLGVVGDWSEVIAPNGTRGWVQTEFIEPVSGGGTDVGTAGQFRVITSPEGYTTLGVRSEARRTNPNEENVITWLATGDLITRSRNDGEWSEVTAPNGKTGWVETERIEPTGSSGGTGSVNGQFRVNGEYEFLGVRSAPEQTTPNEENVDTWVPRGDIVTRTGVQGAWSKVVAPNSIEGWVQTEYLEAIGGSGSPAPLSGQFEVIASPEGYTTLGVRSEARRTNPNEENVITWLTVGDNVNRRDVDGEWSYIQAPNGMLGYVETVRLRSTGGGGSGGPSTPVDVGPLPADGTPIIIFDTDMGPDIDDALALAMLHEYANRGMAKIAAVTMSRNSDWGVKYISLLNTYYGRGAQIPIGAFKGSTGVDRDEEYWYSRKVVAGGQHPYDQSINMANVPAGHEVMRAVLERAAPNSVAIVQVGFSTNTAELLRRYPDLVREKAPLLSIMAGQDGQRKDADFNTKFAVADAQKVWADWPHKVIQSEQRLGGNLLYPYEEITGRLGSNHPIRQSYEARDFSWHEDNPPFYNMRTWDLTSVMEAVEPDAYLPVDRQGWVSIDTSVTNTVFRADSSGRHFVLQSGLSDAEKQRTVNRMVELVSAPPSSNPDPPTPPTSSGWAGADYAENPFRCDGVSRIAGRFTGFSDNEPVTIAWPGGSKTEPAVNGVRTFRWRCFSGSETVTLNAFGEVSRRRGTAVLETYTPAPPPSSGSGGAPNPGACPADKDPNTPAVTYPAKLTRSLVPWYTRSCDRQGSISDHSTFTWLGYYGEWSWVMLGVRSGGTQGWVRSEYLESAVDPGIIFPSPPPPPSPPSGGGGPGDGSPPISSPPRPLPVECLESAYSIWDVASPLHAVPDDRSPIPLRKQPDDKCLGLVSIQPGTFVHVLKTATNVLTGRSWYYVRTPSGSLGYIPVEGLFDMAPRDDNFITGCFDFMGDTANDLIGAALSGGAIQQVYSDIKLGRELHEESKQNPELFHKLMQEQFDGLTQAPLYRISPQAWAGYMTCNAVLALLSRGGTTKQTTQTKYRAVLTKMRELLSLCSSFAGNTPVLMADGSSTPISLINVGDMVWAQNPETGETGSRGVVAVWGHTATLYEWQIGKATVTSTGDHPFWNATDGVWQGPDEFDLADTVLTHDGGQLPTGRLLWHTAEEGIAYDLSVSGLDTFHVEVDGRFVLVHNAKCKWGTTNPSAIYRKVRPSKPSLADATYEPNFVKPRRNGDLFGGWPSAPVSDTKYHRLNDNSGWLAEKTIGGNSVVVKYSNDGYPDFRPYRDYEVNIGPFATRVDGSLDRATDFKEANVAIEKPEWGNGPPENWVWHHVEDGSTLQLVEEAIHAAFRHQR